MVIDALNHPVKHGTFTTQVIDGITGVEHEFGEDRYLEPSQRAVGWPAIHLYPFRNREAWDPVAAAAYFSDWTTWSLPGGCDCAGHWGHLIKTKPPVFDSPDAFFAWTNDAHNEVNARIDRDGSHPPLPLARATEIWSRIAAAGQVAWFRPVKDTIKGGRRLVITIATGKAREWLRVTQGPMEAYAKKCGADFVILQNTTQGWWGLEKFRVHEFAKQYDQTLFIDADVLVTQQADDWWRTTFPVYIHEETDYLPSSDWLQAAWSLVMQCRDEPPVEYMYGRSLNSGVVLCSREGAAVWTPPKLPIPITHVSEQINVTANLKHTEYQFGFLPSSCNLQVWHPHFDTMLSNAEFVHVSGQDRKLEQLKQLRDRLAEVGNPVHQ